MSDELIIPKRIQLETVFGCNARCTMCPVHKPAKREKGVMSMDLFKYIIDEMSVYKDQIEKVDLWGLGEPLLDKNLFDKIRYTKEKGFNNLAIATNVDLLDNEKQKELLESKIETIIFSLDGVKKETHENIRQGTNFDNIIKNVQDFIIKRNKGKYETRFVFRFIRQESNLNEWELFKQFWNEKISKDKRDMLIGYNAHNWGGELKDIEIKKAKEINDISCHHIFDRLIVLADGTVPLCCSDLHHAENKLGNVKNENPIKIFNNNKIVKIRKIHTEGNRLSMKICKECGILNSEDLQEIE